MCACQLSHFLPQCSRPAAWDRASELTAAANLRESRGPPGLWSSLKLSEPHFHPDSKQVGFLPNRGRVNWVPAATGVVTVGHLRDISMLREMLQGQVL